MTEEEHFRKHYPDSCYGDRPLSPYWDFFQDGVEFGERQSEKKITEREQQIEKLENENAELKEEMKAKQVVLNDFKSRVETVTDRFNKKSSQLTKAKKLLNEFMRISKASDEDFEHDYSELIGETEQFIKDLEK